MSGSSDRRTNWRVLLTALLTLLFAGFLVAPMVLLLRAHDLHLTISDYLTGGESAMLYRTRIELDQVVTVLHRVRLGDPEVALDDLKLAYDVLYGRREMVASIAGEGLPGPLLSLGEALDALEGAIAAADAALDPAPSPEALPRIASSLLEGLEPAQAAVAALVRDFHGATSVARDALKRQALSLDESVYLALLALLVASPVYVGGLILVNVRLGRARRRLAGLTEQLQRSNAQLTALVEHAPARISVKDLDGRYLLVNRQFAETRDRTEAEAAARARAGGGPCPTQALIRELEQEVLRVGAPASRQYEHKLDGESRWHMTIKFPIRGEGGAIVGLGGFTLDMTREKAIERELIRAKEAAEAAGRAKTSFLANMSHELRTPLNAVIGFSEIMAEQMFGPVGHPRYRDYAADIRRSAKHLHGLIGQILDFTKIEGGYWQLDSRPVPPAEIVEEALRMLWPLAEERGLSLVTRVEDPPGTIVADRQAVLQVLVNLLGNAIKFSAAGTEVVTTLAAAEGAGLTLRVADQGPGIEEADLARLATPFTRLSDAYSQTREGIGLGLSISRALVELHGGRLTIASTPGEGTVVTVVLPAAAAGQHQALKAA